MRKMKDKIVPIGGMGLRCNERSACYEGKSNRREGYG